MPAHFTPERSTSPHWPRLMLRPTRARQLPSLELGNPPKLQPQPKSQLQNSYPRPLSIHLVFVAVAVGMARPLSVPGLRPVVGDRPAPHGWLLRSRAPGGSETPGGTW